MKRKLLFTLLLALLALSSTALAAQHTDGQGAVWETDGIEDYAPEAAALAEESGLIPLGDPINPRWDPDTPGNFIFNVPTPTQNQFLFSVYLEGQPDAPVWEVYYGRSTSVDPDSESFSFTCDVFRSDINVQEPNGYRVPAGRLGSGDYYFTVQNLGDGITYGDSTTVSSLDAADGSGVYHYVEPEAALDAPPQGHWEWPAACWEGPDADWESGEHPVLGTDKRYRGYYIEYGYAKTSGDEIKIIGSSMPRWSGKEDSWLQEKLIGENGAGWYYFRVRPLSADIERWRNGEWSEWSEGYNLAEAAQEITDQLNQIDKTKPDSIRQQVQALNKTDLQNALTADILGSASGAAEALTALEKAVGGPAAANVAPELADRFNESGVSIVGAALNNVTGSDKPTLNIGAPKQEDHVRSELYSSTVAVDFSMDLSNVENTHDLAVPVKVTLPVPAGVNPEFLVILHYTADGWYEEVWHNVFRDETDGRLYVSFILTSFSDFTITELAASIRADRDGSYEAVNPPAGARLYLARYEGGRMSSFEELKALSGTLAGNGAKKLFLLDGDLRPLCAAKELQP